MALFQDSTGAALAATALTQSSNSMNIITLTYEMAAGTTSSTTFKIRIGNDNAGTTTVNGLSDVRKYGGVSSSYLRVTEYGA